MVRNSTKVMEELCDVVHGGKEEFYSYGKSVSNDESFVRAKVAEIWGKLKNLHLASWIFSIRLVLVIHRGYDTKTRCSSQKISKSV